jgi:hypothetical protein
MRNLMKLLAVAAIITLFAGFAVARTLDSTSKEIIVKDSYIGIDRGLLDCSGMVEMTAGVTYYGDNTGAVNNVTTYSCSSWDESGGEAVYHFDLGLTEVEFSITVNFDGCDNDLAVLDMCDEDLGCLGVFNGSVNGTGPGWTGELWMVVDGYNGTGCPFDITITTTPYVAPPSDFCELAEDIEEGHAGMYYGDTCDGLNMVEAVGACYVYTEAGLEDYYAIVVPAGCLFTAEVLNTADGALWVLDGCDAATAACLAYADATLGGEVEIISYTNDTGVEALVWLVIDSWGSGSCGTYDMNFITDCAVANEDMSFGDVKALY